MGRLIDEGELIEIIKGNDEFIDWQRDEFIECANACDTAYDVDAVVKQLNNYAFEAEKAEMDAGSFPEAQVFRGKCIAYKQAIEIVKGKVNRKLR